LTSIWLIVNLGKFRWLLTHTFLEGTIIVLQLL
jgi:hypothetical protein